VTINIKKSLVGVTSWYHCKAEDSKIPKMPVINPPLGLWSALESAVLHFQNFIQARFFHFQAGFKRHILFSGLGITFL
jgi:hypothetical protein